MCFLSLARAPLPQRSVVRVLSGRYGACLPSNGSISRLRSFFPTRRFFFFFSERLKISVPMRLIFRRGGRDALPPCRAAARARSGAMASARDDDRRPPRRAHLVFPDFGEIAVTKPGDRNSKKKKGDLIHKSHWRSTITYRRLQRFFHFSSEKYRNYCVENSEKKTNKKKNRASESSFPFWIQNRTSAKPQSRPCVLLVFLWRFKNSKHKTHFLLRHANTRQDSSRRKCGFTLVWNSRAERVRSGRAALRLETTIETD